MTFPVDRIRQLFPSINRQNVPIFFDNPAGSQVPQMVIDAFSHYFSTMNANQGGTFVTSKKTDAMMRDVREKVADFLGATNPDEIVFGANMTTLAFSLSRALAQTMKAGDEIILTRMDHDANVAPWLRIAEEHGFIVRWVDINIDDCTLDLNTLEGALNDRTKLVATVHCSNAVGTLNPVAQIAQMAHAAGALCVVDAVQSAPHVPIDVMALGCDFLLCSAYKFFGPHVGILWGKYDLLESLPAYKVRPSKNYSPFRWETGTPNFEGIFALGSAIDYIQKIGQEYCMEYSSQFSEYTERAKWLKAGMEGIRQYEKMLISHLLDGLESLPNIQIFGITDRNRLDERCPTVVFTHSKYMPNEIAQYLANHDIYVWDGNYYAVEIMARLGHSEKGMVRVGLAHYNTVEEIDRFCAVLRQLVVDDDVSVPQKLMQQEFVASVTIPPQNEIDNHDIWEFMNPQLFAFRGYLSSILSYSLFIPVVLENWKLEYLKIIHKNALYCRRIENMIQKFFLLKTGYFRLFSVNEFNPSTFVQSLVSELQSESTNQMVSYQVNIAPDVPQSVFGSDEQIKSIMIDLITYTIEKDEKTNILIDCGRVNDDMWYIRITDTSKNVVAHPFSYSLEIDLFKKIVNIMGGNITTFVIPDEAIQLTMTFPVRYIIPEQAL